MRKGHAVEAERREMGMIFKLHVLDGLVDRGNVACAKFELV